jgi:hypothetical protein
MKLLKTSLTLALALCALTSVQASEMNQSTVFTFSSPVALPGKVLPAGTYVFKLLNSWSDRNVVQVFNKDENQILGTFLAIPDYRLNPKSDTVILFEERPAGSPEAIKEWFYPGRNYGHEFVYPKQTAMALAKANQTPVPAIGEQASEALVEISSNLADPKVAEMQNAPLSVEVPTKDEPEAANVETPALIEAVAVETAPMYAPEQLPSTGSWMPTIGLLGLFSIGVAGMLRFAVDRKQ